MFSTTESGLQPKKSILYTLNIETGRYYRKENKLMIFRILIRCEF